VGVLGSVPSPESLDQANDLAAFLESRLEQGDIDEVGEDGIGRDEDVSSGDEKPKGALGEAGKELPQAISIRLRQDSEPGKWASLAPVERRRYAPDSAPAGAELFLFGGGVLLEAVGGAVTTAWMELGGWVSIQEKQSAKCRV